MSGTRALMRSLVHLPKGDAACLIDPTRSLVQVPRDDTAPDDSAGNGIDRDGVDRGDTGIPWGDAARGTEGDQGNAERVGNAEDGEVLDDRRALSSVQAD